MVEAAVPPLLFTVLWLTTRELNLAIAVGGTHWNHHWRYSDAAWRMVRGNRPFFENRVPLSGYLQLCQEHDFEIVTETFKPAK